MSRSKATAWRFLRDSLKHRPEQIHESIEQQLEEDMLNRRAGGPFASASASARGWLERRSRLGFYPATIRLVWAIAGVWDCLRENKVSEATARAALSIASIDQNALDAGSWVLAQELFLEQPAPLSAFQAKRNIGHDASENFHTSSTPAGQVSCCIASKKSKAIWMLSKQKLPGAGEGAGADDESRNPRGGKDLEKGAGKGADKPSGPSGSGAK